MAHPQAQRTIRAVKETPRRSPITHFPSRTSVALPSQTAPQALQRITHSPSSVGPADVLSLQHSAGNRAVNRLLARARLAVGAAGDQCEQQADRMAGHVLGMPGPLPSAPETGQEIPGGPGPGGIQRRTDGALEATAHFQSRLARQKGTGSPLPGRVRDFMEPRFGADFGHVRIHSGREAARMNRAIKARAFTHGHDIYLGEHSPDLSSGPGKQLLAHELAHVTQQTSSGTQRISRWGGLGNTTSHKILTEEAFQGVNGYSDSAKAYLKEMSEAVDCRISFFATVATGKFVQLFNKMAKDPKAYDNLEGYWRNPGEAPNHAEGGMYRVAGGDPGQSQARIDEFMTDAMKNWKSGNPRESLASLGLALHVAEDRGSHGEGAEGTGHDPRRMIKPPKGATKNFYEKGWKGSMCDLRTKNEEGYQVGVKEARVLLKEFMNFVVQETGSIEGLEQFLGPGIFKYLGRRAAMFFGYGAKSHKIVGKKPPMGGKPTMPANVMSEMKRKMKNKRPR